MDRHWVSAVAAGCVMALAVAGCGESERRADKQSEPAPSAVKVAPAAAGADSPATAVAAGGGKREGAGKDASTLEVEGLEFKVPKGWERRPPASQMRLAEFRVAKVEGDPADGEMAVSYFPGGGGGLEANLQRWFGQFTQPDGKPTKEVAKVEKREIGGVKVTVADVAGTYREPFPRPGQKQTVFPDYRLLGAIVETRDGAAFFKLLGPGKTIAARKGDFDAFIGSVKAR